MSPGHDLAAKFVRRQAFAVIDPRACPGESVRPLGHKSTQGRWDDSYVFPRDSSRCLLRYVTAWRGCHRRSCKKGWVLHPHNVLMDAHFGDAARDLRASFVLLILVLRWLEEKTFLGVICNNQTNSLWRAGSTLDFVLL